MANIDKQVVSIDMDDSGLQQGAKRSQETLSKLSEALKLKGGSDGLTDVNSKASKMNFASLANAVDGIKERFSTLGIVGITALTNITNRVINLGMNMAKSIAVDPIRDGFGEYESKMGSIQTILANTRERYGTTTKDVGNALNELNRYADKTIYSFSDMTRNIGLFTNAGLRLDESTKMIQGFSNAAAASGTTSMAASNAAYQLSQALSTGTIRLMDWRSLTNAGMGNKNMQDGLIAVAEAMGTVKQAGLSASKIQANFNDSLQKGWLSADVMSKYLQIMANSNKDSNREFMKSIGLSNEQIESFLRQQEEAENAATKVRTFSQLIGTVQEAVGSGWATTFEILLGDFDVATELFTSINNVVSKFVDNTSDARNNLLQGWSDLGGRAKLLENLGKIFNYLGQYIKIVSDGLKSIIPPVTAAQLKKFTDSLGTIESALKPTNKKLSDFTLIIKTVSGFISGTLSVFSQFGAMLIHSFKSPISSIITDIYNLSISILKLFTNISNGVKPFSILKNAIIFLEVPLHILAESIASVVHILSAFLINLTNTGAKLSTALNVPELNNISNMYRKMGDSVIKFIRSFGDDGTKNIDALFTNLDKWVESIKPKFDKVGNVVQAAKEKISNLFNKIKEMVSKVNFNFNLGNLWLLANGAITTGILANLTKMFSKIPKIFDSAKEALDNVGGIAKKIGDIFDPLHDALVQFQTNLKAKQLKIIATAIAMLVGSVLVLSFIDTESLIRGVSALGIVGAELATFAKLLSYTDLKGNVAAPLVALSSAVLILSIAVKRLSTMSWKELAKGMTAVAIAMGLLVASVELMSLASKGIKARNILTLIALASALDLMVKPIKALGSLSIKELAKGMTAVAIAMGLLVASVELMSLASKGIKARNILTLIALASALDLMVKPIKALGSLSIKELAKGLGSVSLMIGELTSAMTLLSNFSSNISVSTSVALLAMAAALSLLVIPVKTLSEIKMTSLIKGEAALGAIGLMFAAFGTWAQNVDSKKLAGAALAIDLLIPALITITNVIERLSVIDLADISKAVIALGSAMGIVAGIISLMPKSSLAGAGALTLASVGILALTGSLIALTKVDPGKLGLSILILGGALLTLAVGLTAMIATLPGAAALTLGALGIAVLTGSLIALSAVPAKKLIGALTGLAGALAIIALGSVAMEPAVPAIFMMSAAIAAFGLACMTLVGTIAVLGMAIANLIMAVQAMLPVANQVLPLINTVMETVFTTIIEMIPTLAAACVDGLLVIIQKLAEKAPDFVQAGIDIIMAILTGIANSIENIVNVASQIIVNFLTGLSNNIQDIVNAGVDLVVNFCNGIASNAQKIADAGVNMVTSLILAIVNAIANKMSELLASASNMVSGFIRSLMDSISSSINSVKNAVMRIPNAIMDTIKHAANGISDTALSIGTNIINGVKKGIDSGLNVVKRAVSGLGNMIPDWLKQVLGIHSPSRVMYALGEFVVAGLSNAIDDGQMTVKHSSVKMANIVKSSLTDGLSEIDNSINPVITPVLDLTNVRKNSAELNSLLDSPHYGANGINNWIGNPNSYQGNTVVTNNYNFNQTNNSSGQLDHLEIYRNTKSQIAMMKGELS